MGPNCHQSRCKHQCKQQLVVALSWWAFKYASPAFFIFVRVPLTRKGRVHCVREEDATFGSVDVSFCDRLWWDAAGSLSFYSTINGLNGVIRVEPSVIITTEVLLPQMMDPVSPYYLDCFRMKETRRFSQAAVFSTYRFLVSLESYSNSCMLFK